MFDNTRGEVRVRGVRTTNEIKIIVVFCFRNKKRIVSATKFCQKNTCILIEQSTLQTYIYITKSITKREKGSTKEKKNVVTFCFPHAHLGLSFLRFELVYLLWKLMALMA